MRLARVIRRLSTLLPPLMVGLLAVPFIRRQNSFWEWGNAYWLLERQTEYVAAHGVPTMFTHNFTGAFNPFFAYYGGPVLSLLAYPATVFGAWPVFAASVVLALVCGYLGIWWAARSIGLSPQLAILPALVFATTPYVLSEIYGRGAWAEMIAVNAAAVMVGALTSLFWRGARAPALAGLVASSAVVAGTHNLTILLSGIVLPLLFLAVLPARPAGSPPFMPTVLRGVVAVVVGAGLTALWLFPNLWFGPSTWIAQPDINDKEFRDLGGLVDLGTVFSPLPHAPEEPSNRYIYTQPPVLVLGWLVVAFAVLVVLRRRSARGVTATGVALLGLVGGLLLLILEPSWWLHFPRMLRVIQFPYRLLPYVALAVALGVALALWLLRGRSWQVLTGVLVVLVALQVGAGAWGVERSKPGAGAPVVRPTKDNLSVDEEPAMIANTDLVVQYQFRVVRHPIGPKPTTADLPKVAIADRVTSATATLHAAGSTGQRWATDIVWSPYVRVTGDAKIAGRDYDGRLVVEVTQTDSAGRWHATVSRGWPWQSVVGAVLSVLSAFAVLAGAVTFLRRRRRRRRPGTDVSEGRTVAHEPVAAA
jgi:hypothetical protein